jgi:threonyl-tRNA synthetase
LGALPRWHIPADGGRRRAGGTAAEPLSAPRDAHIFCTPDQVAHEAAAALGLISRAYRALGIEQARYRLSLADPSSHHAGSREAWDLAAAILAEVLARSGIDFEAEPGEAAFYGPKIDVQVADSAQRETTLSTVQVEFYQPERRGRYVAESIITSPP